MITISSQPEDVGQVGHERISKTDVQSINENKWLTFVVGNDGWRPWLKLDLHHFLTLLIHIMTAHRQMNYYLCRDEETN